MKILKFISSIVCYILLIPLLLCSVFCLTWYVLPAFKDTVVGARVLLELTDKGVLALTICSIVFSIVVLVFGKVFTVVKNSKALNFYTHLVTWLLMLASILMTGYTFAMSSTLETTSFEITTTRKVCICACLLGMLLYQIIFGKVR